MASERILLPTGQVIEFTSSAIKEIGDLERLFFSAYVPGLNFNTSNTKEPEFLIIHKEEDANDITLSDHELVIRQMWNSRLPFDLYHLLYSVSRKLFIDKNYFSPHSSCIAKDGLSLIVGHSGSGKTTIALNMVLNHKYKWVSGNKTLINFTNDSKMHVSAGTNTITIKASDKERFENYYDKAQTYFDRLAFNFSESYLHDLNEESYLKKIIITGPLSSSNEFRKIDSLGALHALYPLFLDVVNADVVLFDGSYVFSGDVSNDKKMYLSENLYKSLSKIEVYIIKGSISFVEEKILTL